MRKRRAIDTDNAADMLDALVAMRLSERWVALVDKTQRDVAEILSDFDPWWTGNVFSTLREAIISKDAESVKMTLEKIYQFNEQLSDVRELILDLRAAINSLPEVWGGNSDAE